MLRKAGLSFVIVFLLLVLLSVPANAALVNGGFEQDLDGWTCDSGEASAVSSYSSSTLSLAPKEGSFFLKLQSFDLIEGGGRLTQDIALSAGDVVSGWVAYEFEGTSSAWILVEYDGSLQYIWNPCGTSSSWTYWSWVSPEAKTYSLQFEGLVAGTDDGNSYLFADDIKVDSAPVPEPATMLLLASGFLGLAGLGKRLRKN